MILIGLNPELHAQVWSRWMELNHHSGGMFPSPHTFPTTHLVKYLTKELLCIRYYLD